MVKGKRIGWLDSVGDPSLIHKTMDDGDTTICGHNLKLAKSWEITDEIPRHIKGCSNYCRICFKRGGKTLPFIK
jgi:hypothetical protein